MNDSNYTNVSCSICCLLLPEPGQLYVPEASLPVLPVVTLGNPAFISSLIFTKLKEVWPPFQSKSLSLRPSLSLDL